MAHPLHDEAKTSQASKLRKLSGAHGTADNPTGNDNAPKETKEGPQKAVGYKASGERAQHTLGRFARGGGVKKGKGTNVNIVITQPSPGTGPAAMPPSIMPGPKPPMPAPPPAAPPMAPGAAPGMPTGVPPGLAAGMMRKRGGRIDKTEEKRIAANAVHKHEQHLHKGEKETKLKRGGKVYDAGAGTGEGRLEKVAAYGKNARRK